jgi:type IV secretion system protein TrbL
MAGPSGSILPESYFDGLSTLWGGCAYVGSAIVTVGLVFRTIQSRPDVGSFLWLLTRVALIGIATVFLRQWLLSLNDIVLAFGNMMGVDPTQVDEKFIKFVAGKTDASPNSSVWDVIWGSQSFGTAVCYALLWLIGWVAWGLQYVVKLVGDVLLTAGWSLSPIFLSFFMLRPMAVVAQRYIIGLVALVMWPFGWVIAAVVTNAMLETVATANLVPVVTVNGPLAAPALTILLVGCWMIVSTILAPWLTTKIMLMGMNPAIAFAQGIGGVMQSAFTGGVGAAVAVATGGAGAGAVIASAAAGAFAGGAESTVRGGGSARTTNTAISGLSGFYGGRLSRRHAAASERTAAAESRRADAAEQMAEAVSSRSRRRRSKSGFDDQPHDDDPNSSALNI